MNIPQATPQQIKVPEAINKGIGNVGESFNNIKTGLTDSLNQFSEKTQAGIGASSEFLQSNTIVAKIAFLILVLILFLFLMNLGIILIGYFTTPATNPYLINGMIQGSYPMVITQNPSNTNSIPIQRSNNQSKGIEFTWSFWIYINDLGTQGGKYQHIFNKGDNMYDSNTNLATVNNSPGVYLGSNNNTIANNANIHIIIDTVDVNDTNNKIDINNVPIRKWVNVMIRMENLILDTYVNGVISTRLLLKNVPKQNYNDIYVCQNGGFSGNLSNLRYYAYALNIFEINRVVLGGPNTKITDNLNSNSGSSYLSSKWYSSKL
jgi:hypothetical protein